jgi:hypothetical protein
MSLKKLHLNKETLRFLQPELLEHLAMGIQVTPKTNTCPPPPTKTCIVSCNYICDLKFQ